MAGLLDFIKTPEGQGLLSAGFGGLAAARRGAPLNAIGDAGMAGLSGFANAQDRQLKIAEDAQMRQLRDQQLQQAKYANEAQARENQIRGLASKFYTPAQQGLGATTGDESLGIMPLAAKPATPAGFDMKKYLDAVSLIDPMKAATMRKEMVKESMFGKPDVKDFTKESVARAHASGNPGDLERVNKIEFVDGVGVNPYDQTNVGRAIPNPNKPFSMSPTGAVVPNTDYQKYEIGKAAAGAAKTHINVDTAPKSLASALGKDVATTIAQARDQADSATQTLNNVAQIRSGLDKAFVGPFANQRMTLNQLGELMGVNGKDATEKLVNTRNVIQGLARQELAAAGQVKGQGQITEGERSMLRRADSGMINEMTKPEIETLMSAMEKTANYRIGIHNENLRRLGQDKNLSEVSQYYQIPRLAPAPNNFPAMSSIDAEIAKRRVK